MPIARSEKLRCRPVDQPEPEDFAFLAGCLAGMAECSCDALLIESFDGASPPKKVLEAFRKGWDEALSSKCKACRPQ